MISDKMQIAHLEAIIENAKFVFSKIRGPEMGDGMTAERAIREISKMEIFEKQEA